MLEQIADMTSLAQQLKRLALPQNDPDVFNRRELASVLFQPRDAASMDRSAFYALGMETNKHTHTMECDVSHCST